MSHFQERLFQGRNDNLTAKFLGLARGYVYLNSLFQGPGRPKVLDTTSVQESSFGLIWKEIYVHASSTH